MIRKFVAAILLASAIPAAALDTATAALDAFMGATPHAVPGRAHLVAEPSSAQIRQGEALVIDIRRPEEWLETGVLPGALLLSYEHFSGPEAFLDALRPHLEQGRPVALICRTGHRTHQAAAEIAPLLDMAVIDIAGGVVRLIDEGASLAPRPPRKAAPSARRIRRTAGRASARRHAHAIEPETHGQERH